MWLYPMNLLRYHAATSDPCELTLTHMCRMLLWCIVIPALLAGCARTEPLQSTPYVQVPGGELPPPTRADLSSGSRPYIVAPFDRLIVNVFGVEDLSSGDLQVDGGGKIALPLIGVVDGTGLTLEELGKAIELRLKGYVRNPQVTVNLKESVGRLVTIDGQVMQPGSYPVIGNMTLMRGIATARGLSEFAKLDDVVIFRTVNGQRMAALYNLRAIRRGSYPDPEIYSGDIVIVGDSPARRIFKDVLTAAPLLTTPLVYLLQ